MTAPRLDDLVAAGRRRFAERFGRAPAVTASAPGRINVIGEHTDYNRGLSLPGAIDRWIVACLALRLDDRIRLYSDAFEAAVEWRSGRADAAPIWSRLPVGVFEVFAELAGERRGYDVTITGNVPRGAGASSSAAVEMALLNGLRAAHDADLDDLELVRAAQRVEHEHLGLRSGLLDQYASQLARPGTVMLVDFAGPGHRWIEAPLDGWRWLLLDSGVRRELAASAYGERVEETAAGLAAVRDAHPEVEGFRDLREGHLAALPDELLHRRLRHYVTENARVQAAVEALDAADTTGLGALLTASHQSLRDDYEVSCPELDCLVEAAAGVDGCAGARLMGGGFGGCAICLARAEAVASVIEKAGRVFAARFGYPPGAETYDLVGGAGVHR